MTVHEFAHNYVGYLMGDPTPREQGRLTLNPLVHIYWPGWLMWIVLGFGILGSAPISEYRMRDRRWGYLAAVAAGPFSNLLLAIISGIPFWLGMTPSRPGPNAFIPTLPQFMFGMVLWNVTLFIFNLLPVFPFDGWHIVRKLLPHDLAYTFEKYRQESLYVLIALFAISFITQGRIDILGWIINPPILFLLRLLTHSF